MQNSEEALYAYPNHFKSLKEKLGFASLCSAPSKIQSWAAVHIVLAHDQQNLVEGLKLAMIRRTVKEEDPWSGHYAFPGGRVEPDEGLYEAGVRETQEEIGLNLKKEHYLGEFLHLQLRYQGKDLPFGISAHASYIESPAPMIPCPDEVDEPFWFSLLDLHRPGHLKEKEFVLAGSGRKLPCLEFEGHTIWGISYLILRELYQQLHGLPIQADEVFRGDFLPEYPYGKKP